MSTIVTRAGKGSSLTWAEADANFTNLNADKYESGDNVTFGTLYHTGQYRLNTAALTWGLWTDTALFGAQGALASNASQFQIFQNLYVNAALDVKYRNTGSASRILMSGGQVTFGGAASGTAGTTATITDVLMLDGSNNLASLLSGRLKFPAVQNASTDVNTLDDYEEGTFTPVDASGAGLVFTGASGHYTKVGNKVFFVLNFTYPVTADVSAAVVGGLPFTVANTGLTTPGSKGLGVAATFATVNINSNATTISLWNIGAATTNAGMSGDGCRIAGCYIV